MGTEIERKFLVHSDAWREGAKPMECAQGYLAAGPPVSVRVRIMDGRAMLNIKTATLSLTRAEYEYEIPMNDAREMIDKLCTGSVIKKSRHLIPFAGNTWEVDEFHGDNEGLVVAEIELDAEDASFEKPSWAGEEVSHDPRYLNSHLSQNPYCNWKHSVTHE